MGACIEDEKTFSIQEGDTGEMKDVGYLRFKKLELLKLPFAFLSLAITETVNVRGNWCLNNWVHEDFHLPGTTVFHCT